MRTDSPLTTAATSLYRLLLYLYPAPFRREFGREMVLIFRDESRFEQARRGTTALLNLWIAFFFDLIATALMERVKEVYTMSTTSFGRLAGLGGILAGLYWIVIMIMDLAGGPEMLSGGLWSFLAVFAAVLIVVVAAALYLQSSQHTAGTLGLGILAIGAILMALSALFYALNVDYEDGRAFGLQFFGHIVSGLGTVVVGFSFRSRGYFQGWSTLLILLGFFLILFWPLLFFLAFLVFDAAGFSNWVSDLIYGADVFVQALSWIIFGLMAYMGPGTLEERPLPEAAGEM